MVLRLVDRLVAVIRAPGIAAPDGSITVPVIEPVMVWLKAAAADSRNAAARINVCLMFPSRYAPIRRI